MGCLKSGAAGSESAGDGEAQSFDESMTQSLNSMKLHHIGIAVESLKEAIPVFEKLLGVAPFAEEVVEDQKVRVAILQTEGSRIELIEATAPNSPVARFIAKRGPGIHHLAFSVPHLEPLLGALAQSGIRLVDSVPRDGAGEERIAFLHPKSTAGILVELIQEK